MFMFNSISVRYASSRPACWAFVLMAVLIAASVPVVVIAEDFNLETAQRIEREAWLSLRKNFRTN